MSCGWSGKILYINLSSESYHVEETINYKTLIGGRGINQWLLFKLTDMNLDPLDPESTVILGAGPLVGTLVPGANRLSVDFKNVITGGVGSGNCGGHFAAEMKYAGYDHIIIRGKAERPVYLYIVNDNVFFRSASLLWRRNTRETENIIKQRENDKALKTLTIGIAGENLVKFSCLIGDKGRAVGYGGSGALFGSKNLKAIAIRGTLPVHIFDPAGFMDKLKEFSEVLENSNHVAIHRAGGTLLAYLKPGQDRPHGVKNMSDDFWTNKAISCVTRDKFDKYLKRRHSCFNCPVYCSGIYEINGIEVEGIQANTLRAFGSNMDLRSPEKILTANALSNLYGLDVDQTSAVISWAIECFENGIINENDTGGIQLKWGDGDTILKMIESIALRKGFGNILAEGVHEASKILGRGSEKHTVLVKKNSIMEAAMRSARGWALGVITSTKGTGHLRGAPAIEMKKIPPQISKSLFGIDDILNPGAYKNKAKLVTWQEFYKGVIDSMGICALITMWMDTNLYKPEDICAFYSLVTGKALSINELLKTGEKIQNVEKAFNLLHAGFDRQDDMPPGKFINIPVSDGKYKGDRIDLDKWNKMLDEYYIYHNWDKESGRPTRDCLESLGLTEIAQTLQENNMLG